MVEQPPCVRRVTEHPLHPMQFPVCVVDAKRPGATECERLVAGDLVSGLLECDNEGRLELR